MQAQCKNTESIHAFCMQYIGCWLCFPQFSGVPGCSEPWHLERIGTQCCEEVEKTINHFHLQSLSKNDA